MVTGNDKARIIFVIMVIIFSDFFAAQLYAAQKEETKVSQGQTVEYKAEGLRDPFQSEEEKEPEKPAAVEGGRKEKTASKPLPTLTVQGIVWSGKVLQVIVNNKVVKVGDTVEGARIVEINKNGVTVSFEGQQYNLSISTGSETRTKEAGYER